MYLLPTVSIFYVQVELCHIFRDYDGRWQISDRGETQHKYYGTKSLFVLPWILADEIIFIVSYQTMKYKFNYTPLVKFLNFIVWYDTMKTSTLERQSISICSRQGHALIPPPSGVIFVSCQGEKEQLPTCSIIALSPSVTRLWSGSSLLLMPIVVGALWTLLGLLSLYLLPDLSESKLPSPMSVIHIFLRLTTPLPVSKWGCKLILL